MSSSETMSSIERKKLHSRQRTLENRCYFALRLEAFFIALNPWIASGALALGVAFLFWRWMRDPEFHFRRLPYDVPIIFFVVIGGASVLVAPDRMASFYNYYVLVGSYVFTYLLAGQTLRTEKHLRGVLKALGYSAFCCVLYGFCQLAFGWDMNAADTKWVDGEAFPELKRRIFSTWKNPNIFAGYLGEVIAVVFAFFMTEEDSGGRRKYGVALLTLLGCLALTYARGACFAVMLTLACYGALKDRRILLVCAAVGAALLIADPVLADRLMSVFTKMDTSMEMRLALWESSVAMIMDHPLLGIGWGSFLKVYPEYDFYINNAATEMFHAHNLYLHYAAEIGVIGAAAYFWYFFGTMFTAFRSSGTEESFLVRRFELGCGLALVTVALGGISDNVLFNIPSSMLLWMGCALAMAARGIQPESSRKHKTEE